MPVYLLRFHSPFLSAALAGATCRAAATISATASSAALTMLEVGAFTTITPLCVAAFTSTLSSPTPARATTFRRLPAPRASPSTFVAERTRIASTSSIAASSSVRSAPLVCRISKSGPSASIVAGLSSSAMSTTGRVACWVTSGPWSGEVGRPAARRCALSRGYLRPDVGQVVRDALETVTVEGGVLAQQRGLVCAVEVRVAEPVRQAFGVGQLFLRADVGHTGGRQVLPHRGCTAVGETEVGPHLAARQHVAAQGLLTAPPHLHRRVVPPAVARSDQAADDLDALHPLLAETLGVQGTGRLLEVRIWQKGLHPWSTICPDAILLVHAHRVAV